MQQDRQLVVYWFNQASPAKDQGLQPAGERWGACLPQVVSTVSVT